MNKSVGRIVCTVAKPLCVAVCPFSFEEQMVNRFVPDKVKAKRDILSLGNMRSPNS